jgi:hypothetical protein
MESTSETGNLCQAPLLLNKMKEKIDQIDPAGLLNEGNSDHEMDTQDPGLDSTGVPGNLNADVHNISASVEDEEGATTPINNTNNTSVSMAAKPAMPDTTNDNRQTGYRIVDIERPATGTRPLLQSAHTPPTPLHNRDPAPVGGPVLNAENPCGGASEKLRAAIAKAQQVTRNDKKNWICSY